MFFLLRGHYFIYLFIFFFFWGGGGCGGTLLMFVQHSFIHSFTQFFCVFGGSVSVGRCVFFLFLFFFLGGHQQLNAG